MDKSRTNIVRIVNKIHFMIKKIENIKCLNDIKMSVCIYSVLSVWDCIGPHSTSFTEVHLRMILLWLFSSEM